MEQVLTILSGLARELILDADDLASVDALAVAQELFALDEGVPSDKSLS